MSDAPGAPDKIEETTAFQPKFGPEGLIVVATTEVATGRLLMIAYMNKEALARTIESGDAWYWSRSRKKLWRKGETSGHVQKIREIRMDCDQDAIELVVEQTGPALPYRFAKAVSTARLKRRTTVRKTLYFLKSKNSF